MGQAFNYLESYLLHLSKYFMPMYLCVFTALSFFALTSKGWKHIKVICDLQLVLMFLTHFSGAAVVCLRTGKPTYLLLYAFQQILIFALIVLTNMIYPEGDRLLINNMCMMLSIGCIMLMRLDFSGAVKQFFIIVVSTAVCLVIPYLIDSLKRLPDLKWLYAVVSVSALAVVFFLGSAVNGARISYTIHGITFQPSELVKILFVFYLSSAFFEHSGMKEVVETALISLSLVLLLVLSRDLGSALIFFVVYLAILFYATGRWPYLVAGAGMAAIGSLGAYKYFTHVKMRVDAWLDPWSMIEDAGYQVTQSLFAISGGGLFGTGLMCGNPTSIPYVEQDFIFSAITEELGIIFALALVGLAFATFLDFVIISGAAFDRFDRIISFGLGVTYIFQIFLTVGGGTKFIPMTGVTFPLLSSGGTSVLTTLVMFYVTEGVSARAYSSEI
ncbi:MAG: FtsW/RodA/SpoVE family cell cycle protein [Lachnospiraceae bacterium]|nr:FtsW/RodA/SpoVE family cell cycle protein [Lachnospiraceae bacterium]